MDDLMDALRRHMMAVIYYEKTYLESWGPGSETIREVDVSREELEKALEKYVEGKIHDREVGRSGGCL